MSFRPSHLAWSTFWTYCAHIMQCTSNINKWSFMPWWACRWTRRIIYSPVSLTVFDQHVAQFLMLVVDNGKGILCSILFCRWSQDWKSRFWTVGNLKPCISPSWYHLHHNLQIATTADHGFVKQLQKGISGARSDDTKGLKGAILDWIVLHGQSLHPVIAHNVKVDRGFNHERMGALLCPADMDWTNPEFVSCSSN